VDVMRQKLNSNSRQIKACNLVNKGTAQGEVKHNTYVAVEIKIKIKNC
jgi:hypothetical protein